jgi:cell division septum initiation protein DivIVA
VTVNRLVAYNMAFFRKAAGLGQQEFGEPLGWSVASVSAAERSWDGKRVKKFDADELVLIAGVLGVPLAALFLPPEDHGTAVRYVLRLSSAEVKDLDDLLPLAFPEFGGNSPAMDAYRKRIIAAGMSGRQVDNLETARRVLELAQRTADEAIEAARGVADETLGVARNETEAIIAKALRQAEQITGDAAARARALELDAQERHRQAMGSLVQNREELERRVDDLRAFEREYRAKLQAWLEGQFRELLEGVTGPGADRTIEDLRKRASESPGQRTSAVLLREDGTYDVVQFGTSPDGPGQPRDESRIQEAHRQAPRPPEGNNQAPDEGGTR